MAKNSSSSVLPQPVATFWAILGIITRRSIAACRKSMTFTVLGGVLAGIAISAVLGLLNIFYGYQFGGLIVNIFLIFSFIGALLNPILNIIYEFKMGIKSTRKSPSEQKNSRYPNDTDDKSNIEKTNSSQSNIKSDSPNSSKVSEMIPSSPRVSLCYNDFEKGELLGSGGNADVYRATAMGELSEVPLAVKEPRMGGATVDTDTIDKMLAEAETWQKLDDHEHIVSVVDFGSTPLPWIGMEYMDGGDLSGRVGEISFEQALWTALAISKGVRYAHKRGVAHLDLKPSNILFRSVEDAWDVPKVADWGLSKHLLEHSRSVEGMSPRYAAPEQLDSEQFGQTDTVTDVYQLGTVLYELFTGEPPFEGETYEVMNKIQSTSPVPPSERADIPEKIDDILLTALATERNDRYDDVILLRNALRGVWDDYK